MAFQEVSTKIIKLHDDQFLNKPLTGYYLGSKKSQKYDNSKIHKFQTKKDGKFVSIYGTGMLNYQLAEVTPGTLTRITFTGVQKMDTNYGKNKDVNTFKTEVDTDDVLSANKLAAVQVEASEHEDEEDEGTFDDPKRSNKTDIKPDKEDDLPF